MFFLGKIEEKEVVKLTDSDRANGNGSGEYQPSKTYEHVEGDLWVEEDEETGEAKFIYELQEDLADEEDTETEN